MEPFSLNRLFEMALSTQHGVQVHRVKSFFNIHLLTWRTLLALITTPHTVHLPRCSFRLNEYIGNMYFPGRET